MSSVFETNLPGLKLKARGKVRDVYDLGDQLLIVSTDRLSAFDVVLPTPIPDKGCVLNGLSRFWFKFLGETVKNHVITCDVREMGHGLAQHAATLAGRSMLCHKAQVFPIECVVRGYLMGSGWKEYNDKNGTVCGIQLPRGLKNGDKLPEVIFTPATKNNTGHDENITYDFAVARLVELMALPLETARAHMQKLKELSIAVYTKAYEHALSRGIIIADTKLEFGIFQDGIILVDEVLTPDSSRFWPKDAWTPGKVQLSFDKQFVRDYLEGLGWNKMAPGPELPEKVVQKTREKYLEAFKQITGRDTLDE
ncbi:MAG: phosphoribosylaminoimidazolesuccinocarboxamide synthase [Planctomycetota bacterium]|nr:phosphoribosylaminoimidazolesuccinocarboxamide synthase [Planctomycetota bacterium]